MKKRIDSTDASFSSGRERLFSLDLLRGLDMMLLTVFGVLVHAASRVWALPESVMRQFNHGWEGFTLWDIIMPLFIFMCGASVPFALSKRLENGRAGSKYWRHVLGRVALLWVSGSTPLRPTWPRPIPCARRWTRFLPR